jgi:ribosomal protein S18 acetylase RimI-like enzyme
VPIARREFTPMSGLVIRNATEADVPAVRALLVTTWHDTYDPLIGTAKVTAITASWHSIEALRHQLLLPHLCFLIADQAGEIVGHVLANGQRLPTLMISRLYVLPSAQRQGIGARLLAAAITRHPACNLLRLEVESDNRKGFAFYLKQGFVPVGEHMEEGIAHTRMEKRLDAAA